MKTPQLSPPPGPEDRIHPALTNRYLVVSRGPAGSAHFDIVLAPNDAIAAHRVRVMRRGMKVAASDRGQYPVVLSLADVKALVDVMEHKSDEAIGVKFQSLRVRP